MIDVQSTALDWAELELEMGHVRDADAIAQEINEIKDRVRETALDGAIEIGRRLCEVKSKIPVGSWGKWLQNNVDYSERSAQNLMAIFNEYGRKGVPEKLANVCITNALALVGLPDDIKHELIESGAAEGSVRALKAEAARLKAEHEEAQQNLLDQLEEAQAAHRETIDHLKAKDDALKAACEKATREEMRAQYANDQLAKVNRMRMAAEEELEELKKAQPAQVVVERDSEETLKRLAVLEARAKESADSANVILFRERFSGFCEAFQRCMEQLELIAREDGEAGAAQYRRALARAAAQMAEQIG
jgi:hypothetical protein